MFAIAPRSTEITLPSTRASLPSGETSRAIRGQPGSSRAQVSGCPGVPCSSRGCQRGRSGLYRRRRSWPRGLGRWSSVRRRRGDTGTARDKPGASQWCPGLLPVSVVLDRYIYQGNLDTASSREPPRPLRGVFGSKAARSDRWQSGQVYIPWSVRCRLGELTVHETADAHVWMEGA